MQRPIVTHFFDEPTNTFSYVVQDPDSCACAIIDSVLDFDYAAGRTDVRSADTIIAFIREHDLDVAWILETHVHADHLSAAPYLHEQLGGRTGIGANIVKVQEIFGKAFNAGSEFARDGSQFNALFEEGDTFAVGQLQGHVLHTPGHTPACLTYVIGDAAFVGDTLFMPDYGTARCDFPGGDARTLYRSIQKVLALPEQTRLFLCHDYKAPGRDTFQHETSVTEQINDNVHVHKGISEDEFVKMRTERDATLGMPRLIIPSVQVNMRAGELPPAEDNGTVYLKVPINFF
ncbi:MBL fold metallo-hydrolase [Halomonas sp. QX-2]|jgi:glyoxylase-like metal-dependent hydrolase (beta-lactamase superfamily II)|uniref:MBL fold metallo-hydrolase n=1 Tax=Vreelandella sedimenti TaxID=2729618 RepID=A0A7Z0NBK3_9GAMM|nr:MULTISPECIES: MBL fold metallo-hydrolase [Halomonas]NYT75224.1 MBL fold metallo-hydrolase [Halomonas sedimenti]|tara:strand:- start:40512 stop:41378 length:867 start_codon:yes stop_codon:yes gene_type:complete